MNSVFPPKGDPRPDQLLTETHRAMPIGTTRKRPRMMIIGVTKSQPATG